MFTVESVTTTTLIFEEKVENDYDLNWWQRFKVSGTNDGESSWATKIVPLYLLMNSAAGKRLFGSLLIICSTNS